MPVLVVCDAIAIMRLHGSFTLAPLTAFAAYRLLRKWPLSCGPLLCGKSLL